MSAFQGAERPRDSDKCSAIFARQCKNSFLRRRKTQKKCKTLAKELNKEDKVHFLGIKQNVCDYFQIADYIILSSHYEGLSLSSIEGMAHQEAFYSL